MRMKDLILIGGGGHCKACIDVIECEGVFNIEGVLDIKEKEGDLVLGYPIIGTDDDISKLAEKGYSFLITLGQIKSATIRKNLYAKLKAENAKLATVISPTANVSKHAIIGEGTVVMHAANINVDALIGVNCIVNTGSNIEHDVVIGNHCHISTYAVINGNCNIGDETFIGSGSTISNGISVLANVAVGAGSVVYNNINTTGLFVGNPLKKL